ncbi:MAG: cold shock domain-containing protein [Candidatus Omnitrophica bacterium]|nr:cold shock domain-containing protein [Candidatus Omnitrophota bacterium]
MHKGKINKVVRDRGFGFIDDTDGRQLFFHQSSVSGVEFDSLRGEEQVEFEVEDSPKGPRAINVKIIEQA